MSIDANNVSLIVRFVKALVEANKKENSLNETDVDAFIATACSLIPHECSEEEISAAKRDITYHYLIYTDNGKAIEADYDQEKWYDEED